VSKKPGIPAIPATSANELVPVLISMKENIELLTGVRGGNILSLNSTASTSEIVSKINEIIDRLNGRNG
jgi:hypothetical protein